VPPLSDRWTVCELGHYHWGLLGGAGLLFRHVSAGEPASYLLVQRSRWVDEGGSWSIPGGAIRDGETPEAAARREAKEEIGVIPRYRVTDIDVQDCGGGWSFTIFCADVDEEFLAYSGAQTDATGWFTLEMMKVLPLHSGVHMWLGRQREIER
jgi:8-oxo-dGTP pyrophosphatase MutT (NUDIX family)